MRGVEKLSSLANSENGKRLLKSKATKGTIGVLLAISAVDASSALLNFSNNEYEKTLSSVVHHESTFMPAVGLLILRKRAQEIDNPTRIQPEKEYAIGIESPISQTFLPPGQEVSL